MKPALRILISAGPTREPLDPVRFLSNYSTGYLGTCLAGEALRRGHHVTLVSGPTEFPTPPGARLIRIERARQLRATLAKQMSRADVLIMAAAVSDFEPARRHTTKLPRRGRLTLTLKATPDVVGTLPRRAGQLIVGFALETSSGYQRAAEKLKAKRLDLIVGQRMNRSSSPFGRRSVRAFFLETSGRTTQLGQISKPRLARALLDEIERLWYGGRASKRRQARTGNGLRSSLRTNRRQGTT